MKEAIVNYSKNTMDLEGENHFVTPEYAVKPLLKYIEPNWTVLECTDTQGTSGITSALKKHGCSVMQNIDKQYDFIDDELAESVIKKVDLIITNPPYNRKDVFIESCIYYYDKYGTKFALLMPLTALEGIGRGRLWNMIDDKMGRGLELVVLDRRVEFTGGSCWFNTSWFCAGLIGQQLTFAQLEKE